MALKKFRVSYNVFGELSCNSFFACSDAFIGKAEPFEALPGRTLFRSRGCFTRKDGDCWVHCVARVPVHLPE